ncbi:MAG: hypothetical protein R2710_11995 [Acidimicrobiales bacterium]
MRRDRSRGSPPLGTAGIEAAFVPSDPPRSSWLALWHPAQLLPDADASLRLALPIDERIVATEAAVRRVSFADAIDALVAIDPTTVGASVAALATAVRWALGQIAAGSIRPGLTPSGRDTWQLGPLAASARADFDAIAAAYPAAGRATISRLSTDADGRDMPLIPTGRHTVEAIADAVADTLARTSALPQAVGHDAFATTRPVTIDARAAIESYQGLAGDRAPLVTLRLRPPSPLDLDGDFTASLAFQHRDDASVVLPVGALWEAPPRIRERLATAEAELWSTLRRAAKIWLPIGRFLDTDRPSELKLDDDEVDELLRTDRQPARQSACRSACAQRSVRRAVVPPGARRCAYYVARRHPPRPEFAARTAVGGLTRRRTADRHRTGRRLARSKRSTHPPPRSVDQARRSIDPEDARTARRRGSLGSGRRHTRWRASKGEAT